MGGEKALSALFPGARKGILLTAYGTPGEWWTLPRLADHLEVPAVALRRDLSCLAMGGVLRRRRDGRRSYYQANPACPFFAELQAMAAKAAIRSSPALRAATILVVEDEPATLKITRILLESWGYHVLGANGSDEAMRIFSERGAEVRLLLTDVMMPGMRGPELAHRLVAQRPGLRVICMSGYPSGELDGQRFAFLQKPFNPAGLARMVKEQLEKS